MYTVVNNRDNTRTQSLTYDTLNRILSAESSGTQWGETFTIDAWSNLTNESGISGKTSHEGLNTSVGINNRLSGFGYDAAGNTISNGSATYVYDAENRLIATAGTSYIYDGEGERVEKCTEGTTPGTCSSGATGTLYWRGTGSETLAETDLAGNEQEEYLFFNGQRIARRDVNSLGATVAVHYYFSDHLGSHGVVENATGTACEQDIDYYPYGGQQNDYCSGSGVSQNYKFTGKERDSESGLDMFGARYYGFIPRQVYDARLGGQTYQRALRELRQPAKSQSLQLRQQQPNHDPRPGRTLLRGCLRNRRRNRRHCDGSGLSTPARPDSKCCTTPRTTLVQLEVRSRGSSIRAIAGRMRLRQRQRQRTYLKGLPERRQQTSRQERPHRHPNREPLTRAQWSRGAFRHR